MDIIYDIVFPLIGVLGIVFLAYISTLWLSKKYNAVSSGKYIKIIERVLLSKDTSLVLIEISSKKYLLSVSSQKAEILMDFDVDELPQLDLKKSNFDTILSSVTDCSQFFINKHNKSDKKNDDGKKS